ncbi:MAG: dATP pyrophosphohydrolase [Pseudomonadota bacterium]
MLSSAVDIRPVSSKADRTAFIRVAPALYRDDPNYIAPLEFELAARLDAGKNPTLKTSESQLWTAYKGGAPAGRIGAIVNQAHLDRHKDGAGHFGFFEAPDDREIAAALFKTAEDWLRERGMSKIAGPFNFSVNEECGLLVEGFDTDPFVMMPHGHPYYSQLIESLGYEKAMDMFAFRYRPTRDLVAQRRKKLIDKIVSDENIEIRNIEMKNFESDVRLIIEIFNDAWAENWGFIPFTEEQMKHMAAELRPIITEYNIVICSYQGEPAAFGLVLPNVNAAIKDFGGRLLPFNWLKLLWRLKVAGVKQARLPLMGVRRHLHRKPVGAALAYKIIDLLNGANMDRGVLEDSEISWILESNDAMLIMLRALDIHPYKTYRIYEKAL